jgi:hypothetical protein
MTSIFSAWLRLSKGAQYFSRGGVRFQKVRLGTRGGPQREMVCGRFRFRDQEFLKFPIFAKNETKIQKFKDF